MSSDGEVLRAILRVVQEIAAEQKKTRQFIESLMRIDAAGNAIRIRVQQ